MRKWYLLVAVIAAVVIVGSVSAASSDKGRRLAGPFCIGKSFLRPLEGGRETRAIRFQLAILRAGAVRSVAANKPCRPWENRRLGLAITGPRGPKGDNGIGIQGEPGPRGAAGAAGTTGAQGATGPTGATGAQGPIGLTGAAGNVHVTQLTGANANCVRIDGSDGSTGKICGTAGAQGVPGPPGPRGADGKCKCHEEPPPCVAGGKCSIDPH